MVAVLVVSNGKMWISVPIPIINARKRSVFFSAENVSTNVGDIHHVRFV